MRPRTAQRPGHILVLLEHVRARLQHAIGDVTQPRLRLLKEVLTCSRPGEEVRVDVLSEAI